MSGRRARRRRRARGVVHRASSWGCRGVRSRGGEGGSRASARRPTCCASASAASTRRSTSAPSRTHGCPKRRAGSPSRTGSRSFPNGRQNRSSTSAAPNSPEIQGILLEIAGPEGEEDVMNAAQHLTQEGLERQTVRRTEALPGVPSSARRDDDKDRGLLRSNEAMRRKSRQSRRETNCLSL